MDGGRYLIASFIVLGFSTGYFWFVKFQFFNWASVATLRSTFVFQMIILDSVEQASTITDFKDSDVIASLIVMPVV